MEKFYNIKVLEYYWRLALHLTSFFHCVTFPAQAGKNSKQAKEGKTGKSMM